MRTKMIGAGRQNEMEPAGFAYVSVVGRAVPSETFTKDEAAK